LDDGRGPGDPARPGTTLSSTRAIVSLACVLAVALFAFLGTGSTSAQVAGSSGSQTFGYEDGAIVPFLVPGDAHYIYVDARGGHGGSTEHTAHGGRPGQVSGVLPVTPGALLGIQVGGWGDSKGGLGCGKGGDHGTAPGASSGDSGAGGGGGTCVYQQVGNQLDDWQPLIVAGGGGGGGNDSYADASVGGAGGDGGLHPQQGSPGRDQEGRPNIEGRTGGCGGCRQTQDGGGGHDASVISLHGGGGGGGGGGWNGGSGGDDGVYDVLQTDPIGGSGGGGGSSWTDPTVLDVHHSLSSTPCEYRDPPDPNCHGQVTLSWGKPAATATASAGDGSHAFVGSSSRPWP